MNKVLPILIGLVLRCSLHAQTLTQASHEPQPGDVDLVRTLDTSAFTQGIQLANGDGVQWDLSLVKSHGGFAFQYLDSASVPEASAHPGCTFVQSDPAVNMYFRSSTSPAQTELLGASSATLSLNFSNSAILMKYPASFGTQVTDAVSGTFDAGFAQGNCAGTTQTKIDGRGTLLLPGGISFSNTLKVTSVQNLTLTSGIFPLGTVQQRMVRFYRAEERFPVVSFSYTKLSFATGPSQLITNHSGNAAIITGLRKDPGAQLRIYPSIVEDLLQIDHPITNGGTIRITDVSGKIFGEYNGPQIDVSSFSRGMYLLELSAEGRTFSARFIKN